MVFSLSNDKVIVAQLENVVNHAVLKNSKDDSPRKSGVVE